MEKITLHLVCLRSWCKQSVASCWGGNSSVVKCPPLNWKVGCSIHGHWVNCRSAPWARAFTSTTIHAFGLTAIGSKIFFSKINKKKHCQINVEELRQVLFPEHEPWDAPRCVASDPPGQPLSTDKSWTAVVPTQYFRCFHAISGHCRKRWGLVQLNTFLRLVFFHLDFFLIHLQCHLHYGDKQTILQTFQFKIKIKDCV